MRPDLAACGADFLKNSDGIYANYVYNGSGASDYVALALSKAPSTYRLSCPSPSIGAVAIDWEDSYYPWTDAANTITTWLLPILGLLVQAPYESNQARQTMLSLCRWSGSPIASLSYILWNIKVTSKCALMVDMSTRYEEYPPEGSEFSMMRDSLYILCIMNQYTPKQSLPPIEAERLLRLALFSSMLPLHASDDGRSIIKRRTDLDQNFREGRKKGVVPVFISFLWFVFALALSIQLAYSNIGGNQTAHNLALGLLVGWLPILILASTVDRNLVSADAFRERLNKLVEDVRQALIEPEVVAAYMRDTRSTEEDFAWTKRLQDETLFEGDFFQGFAGQGRTHWHYGVAHPLLAGIESRFMADYGRDWLRHPHAARLAIVVGSRNINGLKMFDPRMAWQVTSSLFIVCGSVGGAFILSYFTPTVGLGCHSGGYMIYMIIAVCLLTIEILVWWLTHETIHTGDDLLHRAGTRLGRHLSQDGDHEKGSMSKGTKQRFLNWCTRTTLRDVIRNFVLRPGEIFNTAWLTYIIFAQTFGAYQTCDCIASIWAKGGGFIDFETYQFYVAHGVFVYWGGASALSMFVMSAGLGYIVHEYCTQSHFSTEHYTRAMKGLRHTRWFKKHTGVFRMAPDFAIKWGKLAWSKINGGKSRPGRRSLVWTADTQLYRLSNLGFR